MCVSRDRAIALAMVFAMALLIVVTLAVDAARAAVLAHVAGGSHAGIMAEITKHAAAETAIRPAVPSDR